MPARSGARGSGRTGAGPVATIGVVVFSRQYRTAVLAALERAPGLIPADLGSGDGESERELAHLRPDALLLDLPRRRLLPFVRTARQALPSTVIVAANCDDDEEGLLVLFEAGVSAFVPNDAGEEEMLGVLRDALAGEVHCPPRIAAALVRRLQGSGAATAGFGGRLTPREAQVARLLDQGLTNKEIAARLGIGVSTAKNHVHSILQKVSAHRRGQAVEQLRGARPDLRVVRGRKRSRRGTGSE